MNRSTCRVMVGVAGLAVLGMTASLAGAQWHFRPPFPARAVVGAALEGFLIEVAAVAARPRPAEARR